MSRESYARGFVKAAQAMGVDPVQLAKYAQWAPLGVERINKDNVPLYIPQFDKAVAAKSPLEVFNSAEIQKHAPHAHAALRAKINPDFAKWWVANTNALERTVAPIREVLDSAKDRSMAIKDLDLNGDSIMKELAKIYHDEMMRGTNTPQVKVTAPVKK